MFAAMINFVAVDQIRIDLFADFLGRRYTLDARIGAPPPYILFALPNIDFHSATSRTHRIFILFINFR